MSVELELGISTMYRDATMQSIVLELRTPSDWDRFNDIRAKAAKAEEDEIARFDRDKPELLAKAREELIDKAGSLTHVHPTPIGTDLFDKSEIDRQAHILVENDHLGRILKIRNAETEALSELKDDIQTRERKRGRARDDFTRSSADQRLPHRSR